MLTEIDLKHQNVVINFILLPKFGQISTKKPDFLLIFPLQPKLWPILTLKTQYIEKKLTFWTNFILNNPNLYKFGPKKPKYWQKWL